MPDIAHTFGWTDQIALWIMRAVLAVVIFYLGRKVARWISELLAKQMIRQGLDEMLARLVRSTSYIALLAMIALAALDQLGVDTTSALAIFGAAGVAVGLALKDSLSNFASGVLIVFFKPFDIGHYIEAAGTAGSVVEVGMFNTTLVTPDNRRVVVPNRLIYNDTIVNYSAEETRRVDLVFGIGYDDDIDKARQLIENIVAQDGRVLKDPAPAIALVELADSSVNLAVRPWVKAGDYWDVRCAMLERIKRAFDENGITIPYPQQNVHMYQANSNPS